MPRFVFTIGGDEHKQPIPVNADHLICMKTGKVSYELIQFFKPDTVINGLTIRGKLDHEYYKHVTLSIEEAELLWQQLKK
jgi:hypothetical protein